MAENYQRIFAENGGKTAIDDVDYGDGWDFIGDNPPEVEDFNAVMNEQDKKIAEIHSEGITSYDAMTNYPVGSYTKGIDKKQYRCLIANGPNTAIIDPVGDLTGTWLVVDTVIQSQEGTSGYRLWASGYLEQWGIMSYTEVNGITTKNENFPVAFPSVVESVSASHDGSLSVHDSVGASPLGLTQISVSSKDTAAGANRSVYWRAAGR